MYSIPQKEILHSKLMQTSRCGLLCGSRCMRVQLLCFPRSNALDCAQCELCVCNPKFKTSKSCIMQHKIPLNPVKSRNHSKKKKNSKHLKTAFFSNLSKLSFIAQIEQKFEKVWLVVDTDVDGYFMETSPSLCSFIYYSVDFAQNSEESWNKCCKQRSIPDSQPKTHAIQLRFDLSGLPF